MMKEIVGALSSPFWWFTVVVVGIVINLSASYLKLPLDSLLGKMSSWWLSKSEQRKIKYNERVSKLKNSEIERFKLAFMCNRSMQHSIHFAIYAVLPLATILALESTFIDFHDNEISIFCLGSSAYMFFVSFLSFNSSVIERLLLFNVLNQLEETKGKNS
jgi:hypothetical protein